MNLQQAKIILEKINRLYQSMTLDASNIDVFEKDLMLSYIKQLYESFSTEENPTIRKAPSRRPTPVITSPPKPVEPVQESAPVVPKEVPAPAKKVVHKTVEVPAPPAVEYIKESAPTPPPPPPKPVVAPAPKKSANPDHEILFEQQEAKELSEKLGAQPIKDINKAIAINERFLTINELFSKDSQAFQAAVSRLNGLRSFEEAKGVLSELAEKHGWTEKGRKKKAQVFIKLVRRRYL